MAIRNSEITPSNEPLSHSVILNLSFLGLDQDMAAKVELSELVRMDETSRNELMAAGGSVVSLSKVCWRSGARGARRAGGSVAR